MLLLQPMAWLPNPAVYITWLPPLLFSGQQEEVVFRASNAPYIGKGRERRGNGGVLPKPEILVGEPEMPDNLDLASLESLVKMN